MCSNPNPSYLGTDLPSALSALEVHHKDVGVVVTQPLEELLSLSLVVAPAMVELLRRSADESSEVG
jgi:hypothetical protein